jgi:Spy/CpxP family protein refolding chaperone
MKIHLKNSVFLVASLLAISIACQDIEDENPSKLAAEVEEVVNLLADEFLTVELQGGDENSPFGLRTQWIDSESLNAIVLTEKPDHPKNSLEKCADNLDLTEEQTWEIRETFIGLLECRMEVFQDFREDIFEIIKSMEADRLEKLSLLLRNEITRDEFKSSMLDLREKYVKALTEIKQRHVENLKPCLRGFVVNLRETIGPENWEKLINCLKN